MIDQGTIGENPWLTTIAELQKRIAEMEAERDEALREHTDMMWQRRRAEEEADAERKRREELEKRLEEINEDARDRDLCI